MSSVPVWGCNWIIFMHEWFCLICLTDLIRRKSFHFKKKPGWLGTTVIPLGVLSSMSEYHLIYFAPRQYLHFFIFTSMLCTCFISFVYRLWHIYVTMIQLLHIDFCLFLYIQLKYWYWCAIAWTYTSDRLQFQSIRHRTEFLFDRVMKQEKTNSPRFLCLFIGCKNCFMDMFIKIYMYFIFNNTRSYCLEFRIGFELDSVNLMRSE